MILVLKILSIIVTTALGVMSLLFNFKGEDGNVTNAGKLILIVMLSASFIGVATTIVESNGSKKEAQEQLLRTTKVLHEFNRTQSPITEVELTYWLRFPDDNDEVKKYSESIDQVVQNNIEDLLSIPSSIDLDVSSIDKNGNPLSIHIDPDSSYWPKAEENIASIAMYYSFTVYIKRKEIDPERFNSLVSVESPGSDFIAMGILPDNIIDYDYLNKRLNIFGKQKFEPQLWKMNGEVSSIPDLNGSQIILVPNSASDYNIPERYSKFVNDERRKLSKSLDIKTLMISFSSGHEIWIDGSHIQKTEYLGGYPIFSITLPKVKSELSKLNIPKEPNKSKHSGGDKAAAGF